MAPAAPPPPAASVPLPFPSGGPAPPLAQAQQAASATAFAKDAVLAWYRGEFAAANAIIDALCDHLAALDAGRCNDQYAAAFSAIARRRANWIPVVHMQKFFSVADVAAELRRVAEAKHRGGVEEVVQAVVVDAQVVVAAQCEEENLPTAELSARADSPLAEDDGGSSSSDQSSRTKLFDNSSASSGSASPSPVPSGVHPGGAAAGASPRICSDHATCVGRLEAVRACKRFVAKESVKGHMVNVVKGLKLYEDVFLGPELCALQGYIDHLRAKGRRGDLAGETFIFFNKQLKGNKREVLQLGVPVFQSASDEAAAQIDPIPPLLQDVVDHLVEWRLVPEGRKPNSCVINFFEEDEHSQPYFKPPHLDNPISTLLLEDTTMAFGRSLVSSHNGNYRGSLTLPLKQGSLLVMRGNSADMARHVVCPSSNARVSITFLRVRPPLPPSLSSPTPPQHHHMTLWKPQTPGPLPLPYGTPPHCLPTTAWAAVAPPPPPAVLMLAPPSPRDPNRAAAAAAHLAAGTGVFLPWTVAAGSKKYVKHLPPRIQRRRLLSLPPNMEIPTPDKTSAQIPCIVV